MSGLLFLSLSLSTFLCRNKIFRENFFKKKDFSFLPAWVDQPA